MKILVINAGSSSLKYQLFDMETGKVIAKGLCEKIGIGGAITHKRPGKEDYFAEVTFRDHDDAIALVLKLLTDKDLGVIADLAEIDAIGNRVAHGGEKLRRSMIVGQDEIDYLNSIVPINPLHGPPAIKGIEACRRLMPGKPLVAVFDTSFYGTLPDYAYIYPIPYEYYEKYQVRRYGFHGTSHRYVTGRAEALVGRPLSELKVITCHLGNGSSITATKYGQAVDTSMGFTPQEGVPMGTRSGTIDPTVVTYIQRMEGLTPEEADKVLNSKSGLLGVSGVSSDGREVNAAAKDGNDRARLALDILVYDIKKIIGSYVAAMNGVDVLVFTAGIGENDRELRRRVCNEMDFLGIAINEDVNANGPRGEELDISAEGARVKTFVIPTDEEYMIALDTKRLVEN